MNNEIIDKLKSCDGVWSFVERFYPNYYHCDSIAESDDLQKIVDNEADEPDGGGDAYVLLRDRYKGDKEAAKKDLDALNADLYERAIEGLIEQVKAVKVTNENVERVMKHKPKSWSDFLSVRYELSPEKYRELVSDSYVFDEEIESVIMFAGGMIIEKWDNGRYFIIVNNTSYAATDFVRLSLYLWVDLAQTEFIEPHNIEDDAHETVRCWMNYEGHQVECLYEAYLDGRYDGDAEKKQMAKHLLNWMI